MYLCLDIFLLNAFVPLYNRLTDILMVRLLRSM